MKTKLIFISLFAFCISANTQTKYSPTSKFKSYKGLLMAGYQGWFNAPGDSAGRGWNHYTGKGKLEDGNCKIDMWPDTREYTDTYDSPFTLPDGTPAKLFSSYDASTVDLHFKWMKQYGIDGVFIQRFVSNLKSAKSLNHNNAVLKNALRSSEKYGRAISVMYDLSGMKAGDAALIISDWKALVDHMKIAGSGKHQTYLYHNAKPLVVLWGVGFTGRQYGLPDVQTVIDFLKNDPVYGNCSIMLGVPTRWRELGGDAVNDSGLLTMIAKVDIVQPWFVGRFTARNIADMKLRIEGDLAWCKAAGIDYVPVIYPGFSWHNMNNNSPQDQIPRNRGQFFWRQLTDAIAAGVPMIYVAMFDEIDEGTAIFKISKDPPAGKSKFVTFETGIPGDYYLQLAGKAARMLRKEIPLDKNIPLPASEKK
ncbi:MAG: xylosidase [Sediminibacterium sp.]|nr:xylosidase [Sediminibacterium sp.]